jgi:agmatine/peptidylarginine deiminase
MITLSTIVTHYLLQSKTSGATFISLKNLSKTHPNYQVIGIKKTEIIISEGENLPESDN